MSTFNWAHPAPHRPATITAAQVHGPAACRVCGRTAPRDKLYGLDGHRVVTPDPAAVRSWVCVWCAAEG